jgi:hypothetical protein
MLSGQTIPWLSSPYAASVGGLITFAPMPERRFPPPWSVEELDALLCQIESRIKRPQQSQLLRVARRAMLAALNRELMMRGCFVAKAHNRVRSIPNGNKPVFAVGSTITKSRCNLRSSQWP